MSTIIQQLTDLSTAINNGDEHGVRNIVTTTPELLTNIGVYHIFCHAVIKNDVEKARLLIEVGGMKLTPLLIYSSEHPMISCARSNDPKFVEMLVKSGEDIEGGGRAGSRITTPLLSAALHGKSDNVKKLLELGANQNAVDSSGRNLFECAILGNVETLKVLHEKLPHKLDETSRQSHKTPLSFALSTPGARIECVKYLLEHSNALSTIEDPLHMVAWNEYLSEAIPAVVEACKKIGMTVDAKNDFGTTALMEACYDDSGKDKKMKSVKKLVECGANVNLADNAGKTVLMHAAEYTSELLSNTYSQVNRELVKFLIDHNADVLAQDNDGKTVLDYCKDPVCLQMLAEVKQAQTQSKINASIARLQDEGLSCPQKRFPKMVITKKA